MMLVHFLEGQQRDCCVFILMRVSLDSPFFIPPFHVRQF